MIFRRKTPFPSTTTLPIALCDTFQLVLLLDGVGVAASLCSVDQLFSEALSNALDVSEGSFTGTDGEKGNGLIDTAERGDIDGLSSDGTGASNSGAVFSGTTVDNGIDCDLDGVLISHDVDLKKINVLALNPCLIRSCLLEEKRSPTISKEWATMRIAISFLPLFRPFIMSELVSRSMMGHWAFRNRFAAYRPAEWEI